MKRLLSLFVFAIVLLAPPALAGDKPLVMESGQLKQLPSATALQLQAPTTANATVNLPHGTAPTSPTNGDCWTTTAGYYCRINGATVGPYNVGTVTSIATSGLVSGGTITGTGTISLSNIGSGDVVGNSGASSAAPADTTLTAIIDRAIGSTQGQILYRGASTWTALSPGTSGQVLQTGGTGANPSWTTASGGVAVSGSPTTGNCVQWASSSSISDAGATCGSGGGGGSVTLITETVTSGSAANVTFSSISSSYRDLEIRVRGRGSSSSGWVGLLLQLNADTGSNYRRAQWVSNSAGASGAEAASSATSYLAGYIPDGNALSGAAGAVTAQIMNYRDTTWHKTFLSECLYMTSTAATSYNQAHAGGAWVSTSAVTSVKVFLASGNFVDGTVVSLYGRM